MLFLASHRGLSGTNSMPHKNNNEGAAVKPNIQRHPCWPNQEERINSSVAPGGKFRTRNQLIYWARRIPITTVNWLMATNLPRIPAGATSAMYMGERLEASPIATPPSIRHAIKTVKEPDSALPREVTANSNAEASSKPLRPNLSLSA